MLIFYSAKVYTIFDINLYIICHIIPPYYAVMFQMLDTGIVKTKLLAPGETPPPKALHANSS